MDSAITDAQLEIITGPSQGLKIPLTKGAQVLGRSSRSASVILEDTSVSRAHTKVSWEDAGVFVEDLRSRNGTIVNGHLLAEGERRKIKNGDLLQLGVYEIAIRFRMPADEVSKEEAPSSSFVAPTDVNPVQEKSDDENSDLGASEKAEIEDIESEQVRPSMALQPLEGLPEQSGDVQLKKVFLLICLISLLGGVVYFFGNSYKKFAKGKQEFAALIENKKEEKFEAAPVVEPKKEEVVGSLSQGDVHQTEPAVVEVVKEPSVEKSLPKMSVFLDVTSQPLPARVYFEGKDLGTTPFKTPVSVDPETAYEITADFDLRDVKDRYQKKLAFKLKPGSDVISLDFKAEIATVKFVKLPRDVSLDMEGYYAYDKLKNNPVKISFNGYSQPLFIPFGKYKIELRQQVDLPNSTTRVEEIRYQREFELNESRPSVDISITDRDLQFFPATISSQPLGAKILLDGKEMGITPFTGEMPLGKHELKLVKEGFFDLISELDVRTNTPYQASFDLKTSKMGELIFQARMAKQVGQMSQAINLLVEALKLGGSEQEKATIYLLLGDCYFMLGNFEQATNYYEQAKNNPLTLARASLGTARIKFKAGDRNTALFDIIQANENSNGDAELVNELFSVFKQISPLKSVVYIKTKPSSAQIYLNGDLKGNSPLILSDLALGNYRLMITKDGFQKVDSKINLKVGEFKPLFIELSPDRL